MNRRRFGSSSFLFPFSCFLLPVAVATGCAADRPAVVLHPLPEPAAVRMQQAETEAPPAVVAEGVVTARVRAIVNGRPILEDELRETVWQELRMADQLPEPQRSEKQAEILQMGLDQLIEREFIIADADDRLAKKERVLNQLREYASKEFDRQLRGMKQRANVQSEEELRDLLRAQGLSLPNLRRRIERSFMANEYMRSRIFPVIELIGHQEIRRYYDEHPGEFQNEDRVQWQDIFIDAGSAKFTSRDQAKQAAEVVAKQAQGGADFVELVKQHDQGDSIYRNGDGFGQKRGEIRPPEVEELLFRMQDGQIGVMEFPSGFHIFRLVKRDFAGLQPFDDKTQSDIRKKLQSIVADREYKRIAAELKRRSSIQVFLND